VIIYDLECGNGHPFEGWFAGRGEFERESAAGRLRCPTCNNCKVALVPSGLHVGSPRPPGDAPAGRKATPTGAAVTAGAADRLTLLAAASEALERNFEDVGERFREVALKMHWGEDEQRNIRGTMTPEEEKDLVEEGVEFTKVALPRFSG
jgi:hypothetical protein